MIKKLKENLLGFPLEFNEGDKVHYIPFEGCSDKVIENGRVKSWNSEQTDTVFVVFNCNDDWDNFKDYTGQSTKIDQLKHGWV